MVVIILERVPVSVRGELTRWMLEPKTGVFVGTLSALVRDKLWEKVCSSVGVRGAILVHSSDTEQGYSIRLWGSPDRAVVDLEGLHLIRIPQVH
jgi:CRISPR-associated protein Cas2